MFWHHDSHIPQGPSSRRACLWRVLDQGTSRTIKESRQMLDDCERPYENNEVETDMPVGPVPFIESTLPVQQLEACKSEYSTVK